MESPAKRARLGEDDSLDGPDGGSGAGGEIREEERSGEDGGPASPLAPSGGYIGGEETREEEGQESFAGLPDFGLGEPMGGDGFDDLQDRSFVKDEGKRERKTKPAQERVVLRHMPGVTALGLVESIERAPVADLPPFEDVSLTSVIEEIGTLSRAIESLLGSVPEEDLTSPKISTAVIVHDASIERNKQCATAYLWQRLFRLRQLRWELDADIPKRLLDNLSHPEQEFLLSYDALLEDYTADVLESLNITVPEEEEELPSPLDLARDLHRPPRSVDIDVIVQRRCRAADEQTTTSRVLEEGVRSSLRRSIAEPLIRTGHLVEVVEDT